MVNLEMFLARFGIGGFADLILRFLRKNYKDGYESGYKEAHGEEPEPSEVQDRHMVEAMENKIIQLSEDTEGRLVGDLREQLVAGMEARESIPEIRERVDTVFEGLETWKTTRIVRTEVLGATNMGRNAAWIDSKKLSWKMWYNPAVKSDRTADDSKRLHGQIVALDENFVDPETGAAVMTPPNRPNCRCGMRPLKELPDTIVIIAGQMYDARIVQKEARAFES